MYIIPKAKLKHFHSKINRKAAIKLIKMNVFEIIVIYKKIERLVFGIGFIFLLFSLMIKTFLRSLFKLILEK